MEGRLMRVVWKYDITPDPGQKTQIVEMVQGAEVLYFGVQDTKFCIWALVDDVATDNPPTELRTFGLVGTGDPLPNDYDVYRGTVQTPSLYGMELVFHCFELDRGVYKGDPTE